MLTKHIMNSSTVKVHILLSKLLILKLIDDYIALFLV